MTKKKAEKISLNDIPLPPNKIEPIKEKLWIPKEKKGIKKWIGYIGIGNSFKGKKPDEIEQPVLFLINPNKRRIETFEGVEEGLFVVGGEEKKKKEDKLKRKKILLHSSKLIDFPYGGEWIKVWIASTEEAVALPQDIKHDSNLLAGLFEKVIINYTNFGEEKPKAKWIGIAEKLLPWLTGLAIVVYLLWKFGVFDWIQAKAVAEAGKQVVAEGVKNQLQAGAV